jgi:hypothetical protein
MPVATTKSDTVSLYVPLETPHNQLHDVIGGQGGVMSDVSIAAFDPVFWLHHCNMDRHYYTWMYNNTEGFDVGLVVFDFTNINVQFIQEIPSCL